MSSMRQGYEDWEFWWQCIDAGFVGRHVPFFGLRYRKRPESMLSQSEREHAAVVSYMQRKHRQLFRTKRLLALEAADAPRYAIVENAHRVRICTDPRDDGEIIDGASLASRYLAASQQPQIHLAPRFVIAASPEATDLLKHLRLDRFVFWWLEKQASNDDGPHFMAVELATGSPQRGIAMAVMEPGYWPVEAEAIHMMMAAPRILRECIGDDNDEWTQSLLSSAPQPRTAVLRIEVAEKLFPALVLPDAVTQWFEIFDPLHKSRRHLVSPVPIIKPRSLISNHILGRTPATLLECGCLLQLTDPAKRDICFVLPLVAFGGVEKVALKVATEFRRSGWRCHLLVLAEQANLDEHWLAAFDSILFYHEPSMRQWSNEQQYLGTYYPRWAMEGDPQWLEGLLLPMDAVVNFHAADIFRVAGKLRSKGVALAASLHVHDQSQLGRDVGHNFLALGHEHVLDLLAPCSTTLLEWCHAQGVPADKLVAIPNAPAYDLTPDEVVAVMARRKTRQQDRRRLNVLFLGRLDRQKGLHRLAAIVERCKQLHLPMTWRFVGGAVIETDDNLNLDSLRALCEPPVHDPSEITELYTWADVLLLPSLWEGLPLTILEASRLGVVTVAARVGAVEEALNS